MYDGGRALPQCYFNDGPHFQRSGDVETVLFQCITSITFGILDQTSPNFQWLRMVCAKLHVKRLRIDWDINEKRSADVVTTLAQCFALITFKVLNQAPPNLLGSCRSSSRWYLQNYMKNVWELTSELTSKWIYILKYSSKFHTNLINNWSIRSNSTVFTGQSLWYHPMVPAKLHRRRLRIDVWIDV